MGKKNSVMFIGKYGLLYTDEEGIMYTVLIDRQGSKGKFKKKDILALNKRKQLMVSDIELIVSKILSLTPEVEWEVK